MDERWETTTAVLANLAYCAVVVSVLFVLIPSVRAYLATVTAAQMHAWKYGRWLERQAPARRIVKALERDDLPEERRSA
jgi:hypothetical protein